MNWDQIESALKPLVEDDAAAREVASAFYDVAWLPVGMVAETYEEAVDLGAFALTWRNAGEMVARLRDRGEIYMDWCYDAQAGYVSKRISAVMLSLGLKPVGDVWC